MRQSASDGGNAIRGDGGGAETVRTEMPQQSYPNMNAEQMRGAIKSAPFALDPTQPINAIDETGALYEVTNVSVADNGSIVFVLGIRYDKETIGRERILQALASAGVHLK
jgi:hypothetical protein